MSDHTPGPWILATSCSWRRIIAEYGGAHICMPEIAPDGHPDLKISEADAALIVAAPDLLELVQTMLTAIDGENIRNTSDEDTVGVLADFCRIAITKATGGAV